ncbi:cellulose biosynthesis protein BcsG [Zhongshania aquimaris]|uniref:Cellulose biosynthesis protein BcsG n=1 Tax=Zhongshania aquimaris TaxID=2857107 RepID=A0ABS6VTM0_9GAMM|nr:cellulose biosynthesis protein BcsG [Zhongshania aquimaris]MBW2941670.1 cellulose biosynthesis protein BcsG [Zhongshania aquimaris]
MRSKHNTAVETVVLPAGLGWWNLYFICKIALYTQGLIDFHALENFTFAACLLLPIRNHYGKVLRQIIAIPVAAVLLHYDSFMPPLSRLFSQFDQLLSFEFSYLIELLSRFISLKMLLAGVAAACIYYYMAKSIRVTSLVLIAIVATGISTLTTPPVATQTASNTTKSAITSSNDTSNAALNRYLDTFFSTEKSRRTQFPNTDTQSAPFDILLLSVCSLGVDDIKLAGLDDHPLFQKFDIVFDAFNSATSYSGPAIIRLSRATCGQAEHSTLYGPVDPECQLFHQLEQLGYGKELILNHDGVFDSFLERTQRYSGISSAPFPHTGVAATQKDFSGALIYNDAGMLNAWWKNRQTLDNDRVAALYNTTSLHDGNRILKKPTVFGVASYQQRGNTLFDELATFLENLEKSNRNIVVVLIPEHGAGLRGDKMQISGMRELPSPSITHIPVAAKVIGPNLQRSDAIFHVREASSHQALSQLLANILEQKVFDQTHFSAAQLSSNLPQTAPVSQNEGSTVIKVNKEYFISLDKQTWTPYSTSK